MSEPSIRGIVHYLEETKSYGQKGFRKRLVVLEQDKSRFTNYIPFEFTNDACDTVDELSLGDEIEIEYRLNGRKWQKDPSSEVKFFLNAEATSFRIIKGKGQVSTKNAPERNAANANDRLAEAAQDDEDCPF